MTTSASQNPFLERAAYGIIVASLSVVTFNLLAAQVLFGIAALIWLKLAIDDREAVSLPEFFWPLAAYLLLTIASAFLSTDRRTSLVDLKQLVLFLIVPMVMRLARGGRALLAIDVIVAVGAAGAVLGIAEYALFGFNDLNNRPTGSLTHYMTYSGVIMLVLSAAVARLLFLPAQRIWPGIAIPALATALAVTFTRNAWIGALFAIVCLIAARGLRLLLLVPVVVGLFLFVAPAEIQERALSIFDTQQASNRDRLQMLAMGREMVRDHPWFGVGPDAVKLVYAHYRPADAVHPLNPHLHNVPVQIAAERGLPALAAWCSFVLVAAAGLFRQVRQGPAPAVAAAGLAAIAAMVAAGLFEYNFGDSEFLMLLLGLITLPFAAALGERSPTPGHR